MLFSSTTGGFSRRAPLCGVSSALVCGGPERTKISLQDIIWIELAQNRFGITGTQPTVSTITVVRIFVMASATAIKLR
jgi:hypothetical protein